MTTLELFSRLSYADRNALMDARRKVLVCPADGCDERAPWTDAKDAVLRGWAFEDRPVDGAVVRFWYCPKHKPVEPLPALPVRLFVTAPKDGCKVAFDGRRAVLVRLGETAGKQLAIVLDEGETRVCVVGWVASSRRWTKPKLVEREKLLGPVSPKDKRLLVAAREWPPPFLEERSKGRRR